MKEWIISIIWAFVVILAIGILEDIVLLFVPDVNRTLSLLIKDLNMFLLIIVTMYKHEKLINK